MPFSRLFCRGGTLLLMTVLASADVTRCYAAGGTLTVKVFEENSGEPTISRFELWRGAPGGKPMPIRQTVSAGIGVVLDRHVDLTLADGSYAFRMIRGPEYRIVNGKFSLERTSLDDHQVQLPRMVDMLAAGWTSGDCCVPASRDSLQLRMAAEDLHLARTLGSTVENPIPRRDRDEPLGHEPIWIGHDATHHRGLVLYGLDEAASLAEGMLGCEILSAVSDDGAVRAAVENPFAWPLPVWLASERIDGFFLLGDWLRLDRTITRVRNGRSPAGPIVNRNLALGRWAERIYWNLLDAGLRIPPLAGSGDEGQSTPVGYNRLYVAAPKLDQEGGRTPSSNPLASAVERVTAEDAWWAAAWNGHSVATNGPLLQPLLAGEIPGHVFEASRGEVLRLQPELHLAVRDPVEYLEVIHNGRVHYSARLDEFAEQGGVIPPLVIEDSGWVTIRVVTLFDDHFRAAMTAPWYIDFDGRRRVTAEAVSFFQQWLDEYELRLRQLPPAEIARHAPFIRAARAFWKRRAAASEIAPAAKP